MEKAELISVLNEALSLEEVPSLTSLMELRSMIESSSIADGKKRKFLDCVEFMTVDTVKHSKLFSSLLSYVVNSKKDEF